MYQKTYLFPIFVALTSLWIGWTILVDFFIVRTVFGIVEDFFVAGELGLAVFSKLNCLELITATALVFLFGLQFKKNKKISLLLILSLILWLIPVIYFSYLTPKIMELTRLWRQADLMGITAVAGISDIQQEHQYFHNLYIGLDTLKLFLLCFGLGYGIWKQDQWA